MRTASYFIENGLSVFECYPNRQPKAAGWRDLEYWMIDGEEADTWKCYGIALESSWLVVDVDLRKPEAHDSFARLSAFVDFSETFKCKTARGGWHYWFKNPVNQAIRKNVHCGNKKGDCRKPECYHGIDFLSDGCYVIGPGSTADTGEYAYETGELQQTFDVGSELLKLTEKQECGLDLNPDPIIVETSLESTRYQQWLMEQSPAKEGENGNDYTYNMAAYGIDFGLNKKEIFEAMLQWNEKNLPPWSTEELEAIISNATRYAQNKKGKAAIQFEAFIAQPETVAYEKEVYDEAFYDSLHPGVGLTYRGDHILPSASNIRIVLLAERYRGIFTWDSFRHKIVLDRVPPWRGNKNDISLEMGDIDWRELRIDLSIQARLDAPSYLVEDAVYSMANTKSFHPICDWLNNLQWDGTSRLHKLFGTTQYQIGIAKTFLLASVYRIFYPGYKFDHMLVLAGAQGIGKSYLVQILGGEFTTTMQHMPTDRKGLQELGGAWWIELPELSAIKRADINQIKAFITSTKDTYIPMYGRSGPQDFPRICVPVWTLNPTEVGFITDDVNRRFLIVEQKENIDIEYIKENRDQIFSEAMELYRKGIRPHDIVKTLAIEAEEIAQANKQDETDPWEEAIRNWSISTNKERITNQEIFIDVLGFYRTGDWDKKSQQRIGICLKKLGWVKKKSMGNSFYVKEDEESIETEFEV